MLFSVGSISEGEETNMKQEIFPAFIYFIYIFLTAYHWKRRRRYLH